MRNRGIAVGVLVGRCHECGDQPIVQPLVVALEMVVLDELGDRAAKVASPSGTSLSRHSDFDGEHEAFATAFRLGLCGGSLRHVMPVAPRTARNASVNSGSRSWIR